MAISKGRLFLGGLSVIGVIGGLILDNQENEQARKDQKQAAYKAGCDVAREFYEKKGNPNARRKNKGGKSS